MANRLSGYAEFIPPPPIVADCAYVVYESDPTDPGSYFSLRLYVAGHNYTEHYIFAQNVFSLGKQYSDPTLSPDNSWVVFGIVPQSGSLNSVIVMPEDGTSQVTVATYANTVGGGTETGMQPSWHPDSDTVIYTESVAPSDTSQIIHTVQKDGSGDVALISHNRNTNGFVMFPMFNFDGSRIAWYSTSSPHKLWTALADGSGVTNFTTRADTSNEAPISWANTQDKMVWWDPGGDYKIANGDGSGITTIWTDPDPYWGNSRFAWLPDDSGIVVLRYVSTDPDPQFILTVIDPGGGGITDLSPERRSIGAREETDVPRVFNGRIWWCRHPDDYNTTPTADTKIVSVLPDGTDYTEEQTILDFNTTSDFEQDFYGFDGREF